MSAQPQPVTVAVSRRVRAGYESEFDAWAQRLMHIAEGYPGHLGAGLIRSAASGGEQTIVYRFDSQEHFDAWQSSADRERLIAEAREFLEGTPR
jgi:antibiotic biosynthesis monooxygenase (ABM) superfamily enzyme